MAKSYEELKITDDFMFGKVMEDKNICKETLECLLGRPVGPLQEVQSQRQVVFTQDGKPIRLDVYTRDHAAVYDAEMQNLNNKTVESLELPKRTRFYQSSIDMDILDKGVSYRELPEGNVLFICTFDPFGLNQAVYTFENRCVENQSLSLGDQTKKWFFNCACDLENLPDSLRSLLNYMKSGKVESDLTKRIDQAVEKAKRNEIWRSEYMKERLFFEDAREDGLAEGRAEGRVEGKAEAKEECLCALVSTLKEFCPDFQSLYERVIANPIFSDVSEEAVKKYLG